MEEWYDLILEGTKAKVYKHFNDDRFSVSFATYRHAQELFRMNQYEAESFEGVDF